VIARKREKKGRECEAKREKKKEWGCLFCFFPNSRRIRRKKKEKNEEK